MPDAVAISAVIPVESIAGTILFVRGQRVILDADLARLYGVQARRLNEQVKRNLDRFPSDFMFQLTREDVESLRSQIATLKTGRGQHRKYLPYAFTEHGALQAANVLNSPRAAEASIYVIRAFVRLREILATNTELAHKLEELESRLTARLDQHDDQISLLMDAIRALMTPPETLERRIGFRAEESL